MKTTFNEKKWASVMGTRTLASALSGRVALLGAACCYALALSEYYYLVDTRVSAYLGHAWFKTSILESSISLGFSLVPILWLPTRLVRPSDLAILYTYAIGYLPAQVLNIHFVEGDPKRSLWLNVIYLILFAATDLSRRGRPIRIPKLSVKRSIVTFWAVMLVISLATLLLATRSVDFKGFDLSLVYEQRMIARGQSEENVLSAYAFPLILHGLAPFVFVVGLAKRKVLLSALALVCFAITFGIAGTKSSLGLIILLAVGVFLGHRSSSHGGVIMLLSLAGFAVSGALAFVILDDVWFGSLTVGRVIVTPVALSFGYFDFFRDNPYFYMCDVNGVRQVFEALGVPLQYKSTKGFVLGEWIFGSVDANANVNAWVNGFGDFGFLGSILVAVLIGAFFRVVDSLGGKDEFRVAASTAFFYAFLFSEMAFYSTIFGGGLVLSVPLLWLYCGKRVADSGACVNVTKARDAVKIAD